MAHVRRRAASTRRLSRAALEQLAQPLPPELVSERTTEDGEVLRYVEGWRAIEQANAVFGHDRWGAEVVGEVAYRPLPAGDRGNGPAGIYTATVRVAARGCPPTATWARPSPEPDGRRTRGRLQGRRHRRAEARTPALRGALRERARSRAGRRIPGRSRGRARRTSPPRAGDRGRSRRRRGTHARMDHAALRLLARRTRRPPAARRGGRALARTASPQRGTGGLNRWTTAPVASSRRATDATTSPGSRCPSARYRASGPASSGRRRRSPPVAGDSTHALRASRAAHSRDAPRAA